MSSTLTSPIVLPDYLQPGFQPPAVSTTPISAPVSSAVAPVPSAAPAAAAPTPEPTPKTPEIGKVEDKKYSPISVGGGSMMATGASIGAMTGNPVIAVAGAGAGYLVDSLILAKEKEEARKQMEKQMRLEMQRQRYMENKRATASRLNAMAPRVQYMQGQQDRSKNDKMARLNSIYQSVQGRIQGGFTR